MLIHVVKSGETVTNIARQYGVSVQRLMYDNEIYDPSRLVVGQALLILFPAKVHQVKEGETLYSIAREYQVSVLSLVRNNPYLIEQEGVSAGESLVISYKDEKRRSIDTGGYVYPFVNKDVLEKTLPYLSTLSIFSYGFTMEGDLIGTDDEEIIEITRKYGVEPVLVIAPLGADGNFNNALVTAASKDPEVQANLINQLLSTVIVKGYSGVNVDFEFVRGEDAEGFASFVDNLRGVLNEQGYFVTVALAPKTDAAQAGLLYEGMDYAALGNASDRVFLMTYEWGYTFGPPLPVAPLNKVEEVVNFAVTQISTDKIDLGMANYGYDWALPFIKGESKAASLGLNEAIQIAYANNAEILYDEIAKSPYFSYTKENVEHIVWFEDVRSILGKLDLVEQKTLSGIGYWQLMKYFRPNWMLVNALYEIE